MRLNELEARLPALYYSALEEGGPSYYFTSPPGRGKTSVLMTFPKTMKRLGHGTFGMSIINGANFTLMTALGFMVWSTNSRSQEVSKFTLPYWWTTSEGKALDEYPDGGIILVDEYDKLGMDEKKIVGEAALSKVLGNHRFPPGWVVMFAGNRLSDRSGSTRDLDHMIMRRISLEVQDDVEATIAYYRTANVLPETITFAEENPQLLFEPQPEDQRPRCSPRTLHQVDIHLRSLMSSFGTTKIPVDPLTQEEIKGGIGGPACAQFVKTIQLGQQLLPYEEVIAKPTTAALPHRPDAMRLMAYKMASRVSDKDAKQALLYMERMPQEHQAMFVKMVAARNHYMMIQKDFALWCGRNAALVAILTRYNSKDR